MAGAHPAIALHMTAHGPSRELCEAFSSAVVSTSANPNTAKPVRNTWQFADYVGDDIAGIPEGDPGKGGKARENRDLATGMILRHG